MNLPSLAAGLGIGVALQRWVASTFTADSELIDLTETPPVSHHDVEMPDGGVLHVTESGSGRPVVLLHGVTLQGSIWRHQMQLGEGIRVLAVDLLGHGESTAGIDGLSIETNATALAVLLEELDLRHAVVCGHSMGGMVLGQFLVDHAECASERVARVGFIGSAGRLPYGLARRRVESAALRLEIFASQHPQSARRMASIPDNDLGRLFVQASFGRGAQLADVQETAACFEAMPVDNVLAYVPSLGAFDVLDGLADVSIPAAVMVGRLDRLTPPRSGRLLARTLPNARFDLIADAGHMLMLERPEQVATMLRGLVAESALDVDRV